MRNQLILAAAAVPSLRVADVEYNTEQIIRLIAENSRCGLIVFPELSVTGYTCADLFGSELILEKAQEAMFIIAKATEEYRELTEIIGVPILFENNLYNCAAVISAGKVCALIPNWNVGCELSRLSDRDWNMSSLLRTECLDYEETTAIM